MNFDQWNDETMNRLADMGFSGSNNSISELLISQHQNGSDPETAAEIIMEKIDAAENENCAFQYYADGRMIVDESFLTLNKAKVLFNNHYANMVNRAGRGEDIEVAIWVEMADDSDYHKKLVHIYHPEAEYGKLVEKRSVVFRPFKS